MAPFVQTSIWQEEYRYDDFRFPATMSPSRERSISIGNFPAVRNRPRGRRGSCRYVHLACTACIVVNVIYMLLLFVCFKQLNSPLRKVPFKCSCFLYFQIQCYAYTVSFRFIEVRFLCAACVLVRFQRVPLSGGSFPLRLRADGGGLQGVRVSRRRSRNLFSHAKETHWKIRQRRILLQKHQREPIRHRRSASSSPLFPPYFLPQNARQSKSFFPIRHSLNQLFEANL